MSDLITDDELDALALMNAIPSARGGRGSKAAKEVHAVMRRELNRADLELVLTPPPAESTTTSVVKIRNTHHQLARLLADGHKAVEVSRATGYSQSRISILQQDPAFSELVEYYKSTTLGAYMNVHERMAALGQHAVEELQERLEETPEKFTVGQLFELTELTMDRTVAPKKVLAQPGSGGALTTFGPVLQINMVQSPNKEKDPVQVVDTTSFPL